MYNNVNHIFICIHISPLIWISFQFRSPQKLKRVPYAMGYPGGTSGKEPACQCKRWKRRSFIPGWGRPPGGGNGTPLQYSCLENPTDRGAWQTTVHRASKGQTRLKQLNMHAHPVLYSRLSLVIYSIQALYRCQLQSPPFSLDSHMLVLYIYVSIFAL